MLKKHVPEDLLGPNSQGDLIFAQRVDELTFRYTRESYRVATTTVPFLLRERLACIDDHNEFNLHISGVERVLTELERKAHGNDIVANLIKVPLEFYFEWDGQNASSLEKKLKVLSSEIGPVRYIRTTVDLLKSSNANDKKKITFLAEELTCSLVNIGVSPEFINEQCNKVFFTDGTASDQSRLSTFLSLFDAETEILKEYSGLLLAPKDIAHISQDILKIFRCELVKSIPDAISSSAVKDGNMTGEKYLFSQGVKAVDPYSAAKQLKRNMVRLHDLLGLFFHKGSSDIAPQIAISVKDDPDTTTLIKIDHNLMQMISDHRKDTATRKLENMIKHVQLPAGRDREKFFRVVDFHGMSLNSSMPENQLINLWTSLETISPSIKGKSIISSVTSNILPLVGLQYIRRTFGVAYADLRRWDKALIKSTLPSVKGSGDSVEKTFLLITNPDCDELCTKLLSKMDDFPLLKNRIFELNQRFNSGSKALKAVRSHNVKVEQQLHRIYRARNSIVHSADDSRLTEGLVISAHEYFDQVFSLTLELCSRPNRFRSYGESFSFAEIAFKSYQKSLEALGDEAPTDAASFIWSASRNLK